MTAAAPAFVLTGPTAAGKKEVGFRVARLLGAEVLALDSVKVYRGLTVGAARPTPEETGGVPLHLVDLAEPTESFSVGRWSQAARVAVDEIVARGRRPLFLGGTPLYLQALLRGLFPGPPADADLRERLRAEAAAHGVETLHARLSRVDPAAAARILPRDFKRLARALEVFEQTGRPISELQRDETVPPIARPFHVAALRLAPDFLARRQSARVDRMLQRGLLDEVRALSAAGRLAGEAAAAIGYREALCHLAGEASLDETRADILRATRRLTRRQGKWFRRFPEIRWIEARPEDSPDALARRVAEVLTASAAAADA